VFSTAGSTYFAVLTARLLAAPPVTAVATETCKQVAQWINVGDMRPLPTGDTSAIASQESMAFSQVRELGDPVSCTTYTSRTSDWPSDIPAPDLSSPPPSSGVLASSVSSSRGPQYSSLRISATSAFAIGGSVPGANAQHYTTTNIITHTQSTVDLVTLLPEFQIDPTTKVLNGAATGGATPDPPDPGILPQTEATPQVDSPPQGVAQTQEDNPAQTGNPARGGSNPDPVGGQALPGRPTVQNGQPGTAGPIAVGGQLVTPAASGGYIAGDQTLAPGATGAINGVSVSVGDGYIVVGDQTASAAANGPAAPTPLTVGGQVITPAAGGGYIAGGQTLALGATGVVNGVSMSVGNGIIVVGGQTISAGANAPAGPTPIEVGGQVVTPLPGGGAMIDGQSIAAGSGVTLIGGIPVSLGSNGVIQVGQETATLGGISIAQGTPITVQGVGITPLASGAIVVNGVTVSAGGVRTLPNGQIASIGQDGSVVVVNGYTATLAMPTLVNSPSPITVNGALVTPLLNGAVVIAGTTVMPGNIITLSNGQTLSVAPGGSAVVINGQTQAITRSSEFSITSGPNGQVVVGSRTLSAGQIATLPNGQVISVGTSGTFVINGTTTSFRSVSGVSSISGRNSTASKTTSTQSTRSPGDAIASGVGATKKGDADILYPGQSRDVNAGFGLVLALVALLAGL
jgi:hypothetical protein